MGIPRNATRSTLLAVGASVLALLPAAIAHAGAGDDAHVVVEQANGIADTNDATVIVRCPTGEIALGGGIRTTPLGVMQISLLSTGPWTADGAPFTGLQSSWWRTRARNLNGQPRSFIAFGICSPSSDAVIQTVDVSTTPAGDGVLYEGSALAPCPAGQRAVGGGIFPDEFVSRGVVEQSGPVDETGSAANLADGDIARGWFAEAKTGETGHTLRVYAICSATSTATIQVESLTLGANTNGNLASVCPTGQRALSGGAVTTSDPYSSFRASLPANSLGGPLTTNAPAAGGWYVWVDNFQTQNTFKVAAMCEGPAPTTPTNPTDPTNPTNPTNPTTPPSNDFTIGTLQRNTDKGTGALPLALPGPGTVTLESPKLKPQTLTAPAAGEFKVKVKAVGNAKQKLKNRGKLKVRARITFAPAGGVAGSQTDKLKLLRD